MAHSTGDPSRSIDHTNSEEPVREKLQETTISPIAENGGSSSLDAQLHTKGQQQEDSNESATDEDMAVQTRSMRKRVREEEEENKSPDLESGPKPKKAGVQQNAGHEDAEPTSTIQNSAQSEAGNLPNSIEISNGTVRASTPPPIKVGAIDAKSVASPTTGKRARSEVDDETVDAAEQEMAKTAAIATASAAPTSSDSQLRAIKRQRSESPSSRAIGSTDTSTEVKEEAKPIAKVPATSGFANTSSASPFASVSTISSTSGFANTSSSSPFSSLAKPTDTSGAAKAKTIEPQTSNSAFKASGFGALANSSASPFSAFGGQANGTASPFGGLGGSGGGFGSAAKLGGFGSALGAGGVGGFGALGAGSKSTPFAGGSGPAITGLPPITGLSGKPALPFGAPATTKDTDDEAEGSATEADSEAGDGGDEATKSTTHEAPAHSKARVEPAHVETGEENEKTVFNTRAKIFAFVTEKEGSTWKERGRGVLKVNIDKQSDESRDFSGDDPEESTVKHKARLVMRADATNRLIMNTPIQKGMLAGKKPEKGRQNVMLLGLLQGSEGLQKLQLKMNASVLEDFWDRVSLLQGDD